MQNDRFPILTRLVSGVRIAAFFVLAITLIVALFVLIAGDPGIVGFILGLLLVLIISGFSWVATIAFSEAVAVMLSIEQNTRSTSEYLGAGGQDIRVTQPTGNASGTSEVSS